MKKVINIVIGKNRPKVGGLILIVLLPSMWRSGESNEIKPTIMEAAEIAHHVYGNGDGNLEGTGWEHKQTISRGSLLMGVYSKTDDKGNTGYVVANAGTEFSFSWASGEDWVENIRQPLGGSKDLKNSIDEAIEFVEDHPDATITFVGHSKGGAEAAANAIATNQNAIIFNPAVLFADKYGLDTSEYIGDITSYVVEGEALETLESPLTYRFPFQKSPKVEPIGNTIHLTTPNSFKGHRPVTNVINAFKNHSMDAVKEAIRKWESE